MCRSNGSERRAPVWLGAVLSAVRHTEENLRRPVTVEDMAAAAGLSLFYFTRVFNEATGHSPYDYLIRRRLSEAAPEVSDPQVPLAEVAARYQFGSTETFARAFRRMFGLLPSEARRAGLLPRLWLRSAITADHIRLLARLDREAPVRRTLGSLRLVGTEADLGDCPPDLGKEITGTGLVAYALIDGPSVFLGVENGGPDLSPPERAGLPLLKPVSRALAARALSARGWVGFRHTGPWSEALLVAEHINQSWLPGLGVEPASPQALIRLDSGPAGRAGGVVSGEILAPVSDG